MAKMPYIQTESQEFNLYQTRMKSILDNVTKLPLLSGLQLNTVKLIIGQTTINHLLGRQMQGWIITDIDGAAQIYRTAPMNSTQLVLASNAAVNISLWVY